jgi:hypothetical protein
VPPARFTRAGRRLARLLGDDVHHARHRGVAVERGGGARARSRCARCCRAGSPRSPSPTS